MSSNITLTLKELRSAAVWAEDHVRNAHAGELPYADIRIFRIDSPGVAGRAIVLCEMCDSARVSNANHHDVTDYDAV
jgi:hypothetical protein